MNREDVDIIVTFLNDLLVESMLAEGHCGLRAAVELNSLGLLISSKDPE